MGQKKFWRYLLRHAEKPWDVVRLLQLARKGAQTRHSLEPTDFPLRFKEGARTLSLREGTTDINSFIEVFHDEIYAPPPGFKLRSILDVGGNIGMVSLYFSLLHPEARIDIFEPVPDNLAVLRRNLAQNGLNRVAVHPFGLGAEDAEITLSASQEGHLWSFSAALKNGVHSIPASIRNAGAVWDELGLDHIDLLKIDCEGAEVDVLRSLGDRLEQVEVVVGELHPGICNVYEALHLLSRHHQVDFQKKIGQMDFPFRASRRPWDAYAS